jgi:hypothetical protein
MSDVVQGNAVESQSVQEEFGDGTGDSLELKDVVALEAKDSEQVVEALEGQKHEPDFGEFQSNEAREHSEAQPLPSGLVSDETDQVSGFGDFESGDVEPSIRDAQDVEKSSSLESEILIIDAKPTEAEKGSVVPEQTEVSEDKQTNPEHHSKTCSLGDAKTVTLEVGLDQEENDFGDFESGRADLDLTSHQDLDTSITSEVKVSVVSISELNEKSFKISAVPTQAEEEDFGDFESGRADLDMTSHQDLDTSITSEAKVSGASIFEVELKHPQSKETMIMEEKSSKISAAPIQAQEEDFGDFSSVAVDYEGSKSDSQGITPASSSSSPFLLAQRLMHQCTELDSALNVNLHSEFPSMFSSLQNPTALSQDEDFKETLKGASFRIKSAGILPTTLTWRGSNLAVFCNSLFPEHVQSIVISCITGIEAENEVTQSNAQEDLAQFSEEIMSPVSEPDPSLLSALDSVPDAVPAIPVMKTAVTPAAAPAPAPAPVRKLSRHKSIEATVKNAFSDFNFFGLGSTRGKKPVESVIPSPGASPSTSPTSPMQEELSQLLKTLPDLSYMLSPEIL